MPQPFNISTTNQRTGLVESLSGEFPDDEWEQLGQFLESAYRLASGRLARSAAELRLQIKWEEGQGTSVAASFPPDEDVDAFLHRMRPFVLENEPSFFYRICNLVARRVTLPAVRAFIAALRDRYAGKQLGFSIQVTNLVLTSDQALDKWLNAFEYHRDADKQAELRAMFSVFPEAGARALFLQSMLERAAAIGKLGALIDGFKKRGGTELSMGA